MLAASAPPLLPQPFGNNAVGGTIRTIPNTTVDTTAASLNLGFPLATFTPIPLGGTPLNGEDVNGILNWLSSINQWQQAGGFAQYNSTFSTAIGGYPNGAILEAATLDHLWISTVDNNTSDPDTGGANWINPPVKYVLPTLSAANSAFPVLFSGAANIVNYGTGLTFNPSSGVLAAPELSVNGAVAIPTSGVCYVGGSTVNGAEITGYGSSYDVAFINQAGNVAAGVIPNTTNFAVIGGLKFSAVSSTASAVYPLLFLGVSGYASINGGITINPSTGALAGVSVANPRFVSSVLPSIPSTGEYVYSTAHGLASAPNNVVLKCVCVTGENGYSSGDTVFISSYIYGGAGALTVWSNATDVGIAIYVIQSALPCINQSSGALATMTPGHWNFYLVAY